MGYIRAGWGWGVRRSLSPPVYAAPMVSALPIIRADNLDCSESLPRVARLVDELPTW